MKPHWVSISLDGSSFDSTQFASIIRAVDIYFLTHMKPYLVRFFSSLGVDGNKHATAFLDAQSDLTRHLFVHLPGINYPSWTVDQE